MMKVSHSYRASFRILLLPVLIISFLVLCGFAEAQEKQGAKKIFDKEYRVKGGTNEGKEGYWVYWGEDKAWWEANWLAKAYSVVQG